MENQTRLAKTLTNLQKNGFDTVGVETKEEAQALLRGMIQPGMGVGVGGSMTLQALGIRDIVSECGGVLYDHGVAELTLAEKDEMRRKQQTADIFCTSSNAVTTAGQLFNVDGGGNRVSAMLYGPKLVVVVIGVNKIVDDLAACYTRLETVAAPRNNIRLGTANPCVKTGVCMHCQGPTRICNVTTIIDKKPMLVDYKIILVNEVLGY